MELPPEIIANEILPRVDVDSLLQFWRLLSANSISKIATYNDLPLPYRNLPIYAQVLDLIENREASNNEKMVIAVERGDVKLMRSLMRKGVVPSYYMMSLAIRSGHAGVVELLIDEGYDDYNKALAEAARAGNSEIVQIMLDHGAKNYAHAISEATRRGHSAVAKIILDRLSS